MPYYYYYYYYYILHYTSWKVYLHSAAQAAHVMHGGVHPREVRVPHGPGMECANSSCLTITSLGLRAACLRLPAT